ncbi:MAG TPA: CehA/McbA family metallohydrolase [Dehalococcoidia bacterium]
MLIDLHTHTHPLSHDSDLTPDALIEASKKAGLDGVCLTEHDFFWEHETAAELGRRHDFLVIPGIEVNTERGHVVVFGLKEFVYGMHRLSELVRMVEAAGGAMIAAHPYRRQLPFELTREGDWSEALARATDNEAYRHVHAIETLNGRGTERQNAFSAAVCERHDLAQAAGSDAHSTVDVGACATEFEARIGGLGDLIAELKSRRFRPLPLR